MIARMLAAPRTALSGGAWVVQPTASRHIMPPVRWSNVTGLSVDVALAAQSSRNSWCRQLIDTDCPYLQ